MKVYIDGKFYSKEEAKISVFDHGFLYGDGIFEGIRIYNENIYKLKEHVDRLYRSAKAIHLTIPMTKTEIIDACKKTVKLNDKKDGYIRLVVSRGKGSLGINPFSCEKPSVVIIVDEISVFDREKYINGINVIISTYFKIPSRSFDSRIKSLNYLTNVLAKHEAVSKGAFEAIMFSPEGYVSEGSGDNIFIVNDGIVLTPPATVSILEGITRSEVMNTTKSLGIKMQENKLTRYDLYNAEECFLTGTAVEIIPVVKIDNVVIGTGQPGNITKKIMQSFHSNLKSMI